MISTEREAAIDEVNEVCIRAADHYEKFDELLEDRRLKELIAELAGRRRRYSGRLQEQIRAMGHMPSTPDPDREGLERLAARFRAAISGEEEAVLVKKCLDIEAELVGAIDVALKHPLPESLGDLLAEMRQDARKARGQMEEEIGRIGKQ